MFNKKSIIIVDGFALIFRAFYAFIKNPLKTTDGKPTSAIFGFMRMIIQVIKTYKPDYFIIALDTPYKNFRHELYPKYKANRIEIPEDLKLQIPIIIEIIKQFQLTTLSIKGYEADDVIGTLCEKYKNEPNLNIYVLTPDKDILQLIDNNIKIITSLKGVSKVVQYDRKKVQEKWGVYPEQIIDLFALMGDNSDNIPGIPGIGPKTATNLIQKYNNLKGIYDNINKINQQKLKEKLIKYKKEAIISYKLITIEKNIQLNINLKNCQNTNLNQNEGIKILQKYELNSILKDDIFENYNLNNSNSSNNEIRNDKASLTKDYKIILTKAEFSKLKNKIIAHKLISIDLESTSKNPMEAEIIGISLSFKENESYFIPFMLGLEHKGKWNENLENSNLSNNFLFKEIKSICENEKIEKIGQNIKYDFILLKRNNIHLLNIVFDTMLASYLLNPARKSHGMDYLAKEFLNYNTIKYEDIVKKNENLLNISLNKVMHYAAEDADITFCLYQKLKPKIDNSNLSKLYYQIELPLILILADMEFYGVKIDVNYFKIMSNKINFQLKKHQQKIWELAGKEFNINSTKQLQEILFKDLKLKSSKNTKTGFSTDVYVLEQLSKEHKIPLLLLEYRKLNKLKLAYLDSIPKLINKKTNNIHASFNQTITQTGRLSSNNPNLQNIPIKESIGKEIRKGFISKKNYLIMSADYSQIELRILAHISTDKKLIYAYKNNQDIHKQTASILFTKDKEKINEKERQIAKTINFSVIYGIGAQSLSKNLNINKIQAKQFINNYFNEYEGIKNYIKTQKEKAYKTGYVTTLLHRIRYLPELKSFNQRNRSFGERIAINTPIQGSSADLIKIAMIKINKEIHKQNIEAKIIMQIHDELVFEIIESKINEFKKIVKEKMESAYPLIIPLKVNISYGKNWGEIY